MLSGAIYEVFFATDYFFFAKVCHTKYTVIGAVLEDIVQEHMFLRRAQAGDNDALISLIEQYQPLINKFSIRIRIPGYDKDDIKQEIKIAVSEAILDFDFDRDVKLITYIYKMILYHFSNLHKTLNRDKRKMLFVQTCSLDMPYGTDVSDTNQSPLEDTLQNTDHLDYDNMITVLSLGVLNGTEIQVAKMLMERMQPYEIAGTLRTTTARISQIKATIARKLLATSRER